MKRISREQNTLNKARVNQVKLLLYSLFNLLILYRVKFIVGGISSYYLYFFALLGIYCVVKEGFVFRDGLWQSLLCITFSIVITLLSIIVNGTNSYEYIKTLVSVFYKIALAGSSYFVFVGLFGKEANIYLFMRSYILTCLLLVLSSVILIMFPSVSDFWIGRIVPSSDLLVGGYVSRKSIIGYTGFDEVVVYSVVYFFCVVMINQRIQEKKPKLKYVICYFVLAIGGLLYGRVSLIILFESIVMFLVILKKKSIFIKYLLAVTTCVVVVMLSFRELSKTSEFFKNWYWWAFEPIDKLLYGGEIKSMLSWENMIKLPDKFSTWIIGDGKYIDKHRYYMDTDIGYLRCVYSSGVFCLFSNYLSVIVLGGRGIKYVKDKNIRCLVIFIIINMFVCELKGVMWDSIMVYLCIIYMLLKKNDKGEFLYDKRNNSCV